MGLGKNFMNIIIEFTGIGKLITGNKQIEIDVNERSTYKSIVKLLGERYPDLIGVLIDHSMDKLLSASVFSRNGVEIILPEMMDRSPNDGDRLIMTMVIVGG